jgi:hypothetical protein
MSSSSRSRTAERLLRTAAPLALCAGLALPAAAITAVPAHVATYIADARLSGSGRFTWYGFHVYDAALYAGGDLDAGEPAAQPFVLELRYARGLIAEASRNEMVRLAAGTDAQRVAWHDAMTRLFPDVARGQRLAGVNLPGRGARFYLDGRFIGAIADPDFARAFFAIWLDERTQAPALRRALLTRANVDAALR